MFEDAIIFSPHFFWLLITSGKTTETSVDVAFLVDSKGVGDGNFESGGGPKVVCGVIVAVAVVIVVHDDNIDEVDGLEAFKLLFHWFCFSSGMTSSSFFFFLLASKVLL